MRKWPPKREDKRNARGSGLFCLRTMMEADMTTTTATRGKNGRFTGAKRTSSSGNFGMIAGAAAGGAALGVLAMLGRKVAVQAPTALAGNWDEALAAEHAATLKVF